MKAPFAELSDLFLAPVRSRLRDLQRRCAHHFHAALVIRGFLKARDQFLSQFCFAHLATPFKRSAKPRRIFFILIVESKEICFLRLRQIQIDRSIPAPLALPSARIRNPELPESARPLNDRASLWVLEQLRLDLT